MAAAAAAKTASTHRAAFVHGTHTFDILGYRDHKALGRRDSVTSGTFRVAGRDWNVVCRFDGRLTHVSLVLAAAEEEEDDDDNDGSVTAMVSLSIDDPTGGRMPMKIGTSRDEDTRFTFTHYFRSFMVDVTEAQQGKLEARYVKDDRLRIRCAVRVLVQESAPTRYCFVADPPPPDTTRFLRVLLDSGQRADVTFAVERSRFDAHRLVLAMRSPVFRAKFFGDSRDSSLEWFRVHDVSAPVFRAMLHFIYTDELLLHHEADEEAASAVDLLVAADLYGLDRLRLMCERTLWERVRTDGGVGSAMSTLALVNGRDSCRELQDLCIGYVADDWEAATATEEYRGLKTTCPALLSDVLEDVITKQLPMHASSSGTHRQVQKSASVYMPSQVWRGTHQFTVLGHSVVRRTHGNGHFIRSGAFEVGGREWRILYYPSGYDEEHDGGQVLLQLEVATTPLDPQVVLEASGTIAIVDARSPDSVPEGENYIPTMADFCHNYTNDEPAHGIENKLSISCLVGPDDSLTLECSFEFQVVVVGANKTTTAAASLPAKELDMVVPPPSISWHLERLLESGVGSDVAFSVDDDGGGELFHAHTLVLNERAPALLSQTWTEVVKGKKKKKKKDRTMMICVDGTKAVVFKALLHFVYTDELPPMDDLVRAAKSMPEPESTRTTRLAGDLLAAAERYHLVERMRPLCENLLCEVITPENAAATLEVARRHGRPELRAFCLDYMTSPGVLKSVVASQGYRALSPDAVRDIVAQLAH